MTTFAPSNSQSASVSSAAGTLSVRVAIDIQYALNGDPAPHVMEHLHAAISRAIGGGLLSGSLGVEVDEYSVGIEVVPDSLDEDEYDFDTKLQDIIDDLEAVCEGVSHG